MARPILKRRQIEEAVVRTVAARGLHATTIQDLADAARVSPGLLYRYWDGRDDLAKDVYREHYTALMARLTGLVAAEPDVVEKLRAMIREFLEFADENPVLLRFLLLTQHDLARSVPPEQSVPQLMRRIVVDGIAQGRLRQLDPDLAVQLLMGMVLQPAVGVTYGHLAGPLSRYAEEIVAALERALVQDPREVRSSALHRRPRKVTNE